MMLVDTSVWVNHLRDRDDTLSKLLNDGRILCHSFVLGELALGNIRQRDLVLTALNELPQATVATNEEALHFVDRERLFGIGIGYVDVHLLAAVRLTGSAKLWTMDRRLRAVAARLGLAATPHG